MVEKNSTIGTLIVVFTVLFVGIVFVMIISDSVNTSTRQTIASEDLDLTPAIINYTWINQTPIYLSSHSTSTGWRADYSACEVTALTTITNYSGTAMNATKNYNFTAASGATPAYITIAVSAANEPAVGGNWTSATSNSTTVTYAYCEDGYQEGWGASVLKLVPGFFVLALLGAALFAAYMILRKEGMDI